MGEVFFCHGIVSALTDVASKPEYNKDMEMTITLQELEKGRLHYKEYLR